MSEDRCGPVYAVRLPRRLAAKVDEAANHFGGHGKAIEAMLTEQALPADWFREYPGDVPGPYDVRLTFRLSTRATRALRAWAGRRPLSKAIRHLVMYTLTEGRRAPRSAAAVDATPLAARPVASGPTSAPARPPAPSTTVRPPAHLLPHSIVQPPRSLAAADAFSHLPPATPGLSYVCLVPGCEFATGGGAVVRCRRHVDWVAPAFSHLPRLPVEQQYFCQLSSCRFTAGDGVSAGSVRVPALCREHDPQIRRTSS